MSDRPVAVVATRNAAEGFAALLALDPDKGALENAGEMTTAGRAIQTLVGHRGGSRRDDRRQEGQAGPDDRARPGRRARRGPRRRRRRPSSQAIRALSPGFELITVYYGDGGDLAGDRGARPQDPRPRDGRGGRGAPRRPAPLPLPDLGRVGGVGERRAQPWRPRSASSRGPQARAAKAAPPHAARITGSALLDVAARRRRRVPGASVLGRVGKRMGARDRPRPPVPPARAGTTTCARCASSATSAAVEDGEVVSARVTVLDIRVEASFRRRVQRTIAVLEDETGTIEATWFGRRYIERRLHPGDRVIVSGQAQALRAEADARQPRLPARGQRGRAAPRRADRARSTGSPPGSPRSRSGGRSATRSTGPARPTSTTCRRRSSRARVSAADRRRSRRPTTRRRSSAGTRPSARLAFDELLALQLGHGRAAPRQHRRARRPRAGRATPDDARIRERASSASLRPKLDRRSS